MVMNNVYDIKCEKNLNIILPLQTNSVLINEKIAVVIHLHYLDTIEYYVRYIKSIPRQIDIYITVADSKVEKKVKSSVWEWRKDVHIIHKQNRGRDISAFLVACRKDILKYDYVCFVHDKKAKSDKFEEDIRMWIQCLWENTLGSEGYIINILDFFAKNPKVGLLVPPPPMSEHASAAYGDAWAKDFTLTKALVERMSLNCDIDSEKPPLTLGTAFWFRVDALKKLFEIEWQYEDFDEEPLKDDGTLSHAIERILAYVAQDAGYETGWAMTDRYAGERFEYTQSVLRRAFHRLNVSLGIGHISELNSFESRKAELLEFVNQYKKFYIYGAGAFGKSCFNMLKQEQKIADAFVVSDANKEVNNIQGVPVCSLANIELNEDCGVIIAVSEKYQQEIFRAIKVQSPQFLNLYLYKKE